MSSNPQTQRGSGPTTRMGRPASASLVDPEDDLPSSNYAGDFETTAIPNYKTDVEPEPGFGLIGDPEPLPIRPAGGRPAHGPYAARPANRPGYDDRRGDDRRGTQDFGLMLLRWAVGAILIVHGLQKAFGLFGGPGLDGWGDSLTEMGYQHADILTYIGTGGQILRACC